MSKGHFSPIIESFELRLVTCNRIPWSQRFFLIFLRERDQEQAAKRRQRVAKVTRRERKPLVTLTSNLTIMQTTGSVSDPRALIG